MPKNADSLNRSLFELLQSKGYDPTMLSTSGKEIPTPEEAEVFQFNFIKDGEDYGKVTMSIDGSHKLVIYFNDEVANSEKEDSESGDLSWYQLLNQLKRFAQKYQLSFELRNVSNLKHDMAKREYMKKKESIAEGYYPMGKKASYSDAVPSVKIVLQHTRQIEEGEQRYRNVAKIFLENEHGERFLAPTTKPGIARVYARHLAEGGLANDERWNHIKSLCEEYQKMAGFVRATRSGQFNESTQKLIAEGINHYQSLRESLGKLAGHRGYNAYFESWTPTLMEDDSDTSTLNELFVQETVDPRIESVMPILARLSKNISEMNEVNELAEWADKLVEGDEDIEDNEVEDAADNAEQELTEAPGAETLKHNQNTEKSNLKAFELDEGMTKDAMMNDAEKMSLEQFVEKYGDEDWIKEFYHTAVGTEDVEEGFIDTVKKVGGKVLDKLGHGSDDELLRDLQKKAGIPSHAQHAKPRMAVPNDELKETPNTQFHEEDMAEALHPMKKQRLQDLIDQYTDATDPEYMGNDDYEDIIAQIRAEFGDRTADSVADGPSMHFPRPGHVMGHDDLEFKQMRKNLSPNRITKVGKLHKQDSDAMKRDIKSRLDISEEEVEESALQAWLGREKYGKEGMEELQRLGREHASKEKVAKAKAKFAKEDMEEGVAEGTKTGNPVILKGCDFEDVVNWLVKNVGPVTKKSPNYYNGWEGRGWILHSLESSNEDGIPNLELSANTKLTNNQVLAKTIQMACSNQQGVAEGLNEFAPDGFNSGGDGSGKSGKGPKARAKAQMIKAYGPGIITFRKTSNGGYFIQHEDDFGDTNSHQYDPQTGKVDFSGVTRSSYYGEGLPEGQLNELSPELLQRYQDQADSQGGKKRMQGSKIADYKLGNRYRLDGDSREAKITARLLAKQAAAKAANPQQSDQSYGHGGFDSDRNSIKFGRTYDESAEGVAEDLDANQKRAKQLGPTTPVGKNEKNLRGMAVGASESTESTEEAITEMDSPGPNDNPWAKGGKATPIKADKAKKDFSKILQKSVDKHNKAKQDTDKKVAQHQVKESIQLDEGVMDSIKGIVGKIKAIPGIQKFIQAAQAKKAELIQAAQQSRNGQELVKNIQAIMGGQQAVAEGWGQKLSGGLVASAGGGLMATGAEMFMRAWNAMGKPDLAQMMTDPGRDGQIVLALVTMLVLVGALSLFGGGHMFKQGLEKDAQPMREGQEDLEAILRIIRK